MPDHLTPEQRSSCMKKIKQHDTSIEVKLRKALWHKGYRYRKNYKALPGKPDIVLTKYKIAIFCDSEFFHGKDWEDSLKERTMRGKDPEFWSNKILHNRKRDREVSEELEKMGWTVLRFWGKDIKKDVDNCVRIIENAIVDQIVGKVPNSTDDDLLQILTGSITETTINER